MSATNNASDEAERAQAVMDRPKIMNEVTGHLEQPNEGQNPPTLVFAAVKFVSHLLAHESDRQVPVLLDRYHVCGRLINLLDNGLAGLATARNLYHSAGGSADGGTGDDTADTGTRLDQALMSGDAQLSSQVEPRLCAVYGDCLWSENCLGEIIPVVPQK